jgi:predicted transcriptional regulator
MKSGITSRTRILRVLEKRVSTATAIAIETGQSYDAVFHHLRLLEAEGTVKRMGKKPYAWTITGLGQKQLS